MRALLVGDIHAQQNNLEDTAEIFKLVETILNEDPSITLVCFLGDIFHTHDVLRQEVAFFIRKTISKLLCKSDDSKRKVNWVAIAGNHDFSTPTAVKEFNSVELVLGDLINEISSP